MTTPAICTKAQVRRIIRAAREEGLRVAGIKPDGTIIVHDGKPPLSSADAFELDEKASTHSKWEDVAA